MGLEDGEEGPEAGEYSGNEEFCYDQADYVYTGNGERIVDFSDIFLFHF